MTSSRSHWRSPTCTVSTQQLHTGRDDAPVQRRDAAERQSDQKSSEADRQQREEEDRQVGQVPHLTQNRCHDLPLGGLSHPLDGGEQQDGLQDLRRKQPRKNRNRSSDFQFSSVSLVSSVSDYLSWLKFSFLSCCYLFLLLLSFKCRLVLASFCYF